MATTVLPVAIAGTTTETNPSSGCSDGAATPTTPTGSFIASVTPRIGVWCTWPSHLSAHAAYVNSRAIVASTSGLAVASRQFADAAPRTPAARAERFSAM